MIKIYVEIVLEDGKENKEPPVELFVPEIPRKGDFLRVKENANDLSDAYVVTSIVFFEEKNQECSVCVCVTKPAAA
jgi:hypothetical protein